MRISQLAERCGVPATTLRFYEAAGLLSAGRTPGGYRVYGEDAVERLAFIGAGKRLGLALEEIGELLAVWEGGVCARVKAGLRPRVVARLAEAERRNAELGAFAASLHAALGRLDSLPERAGRCDAECGFPGGAGAGGESAGSGPGGGFGSGFVDAASASTPASVPGERWRSAPVVCSLGGEGVAERAGEWRRVLEGAGRGAVLDGVRVTLPVGRVGRVVELAAAEQRCCPFFDFRVHLDGGVVHLEVRAPAEGTGLLAELFGPLPGVLSPGAPSRTPPSARARG
ncbi:MerR family transcriptional regulator [Streptomyces sp. NPDC050560]|uniref:MerR family transcriptional regulator n=1 Tax=Streptomyces sp. NPDC050560 TaxID=3365630 RepID=UPI0037B4FFBF